MMWKKVFARMQVGFISTVLAVMLIEICIAQNGGSTVTERFASHFAAKDAAVLTQLLLVGGIGVFGRIRGIRSGALELSPAGNHVFCDHGGGVGSRAADLLDAHAEGGHTVQQPRLDGHLRDHVGDSVRGIPQADTRSEPEDS